MRETLNQINKKNEIIVKREKNGKLTEKNIRPAILETLVNNGDNPYWEAVLSLAPGSSCKPSEFVSALCPSEDFSGFLVCRVECVLAEN
jgi:hypothetical protein